MPINFRPPGRKRMLGRQRLAGAGFGPDLCPGFVPLAGGVGGRIAGEDGAVELFVAEAQPGASLNRKRLCDRQP